jgi:histidine decarboxylase
VLGCQSFNEVRGRFVEGPYRWHQMEREVITIIGDLFRAPADDRWGYLTSGESESNLAALHRARERYPDAVVYFSAAARRSITKHAATLRMPTSVIATNDMGEMDYQDLAAQLVRHRHRPAIIVATIGTTMMEAVDDLRLITATVEAAGARDRWIHADAALAGLPLALLDPDERPGIDFADGADSMAVDGHAFIGVSSPCAVMIVRRGLCGDDTSVGRMGSPNATITGSRSGHDAFAMWCSLRKQGIAGLRRRAEASRGLAVHAKRRLDDIGWASFRHPHAFTVVLKTPPQKVADKWILATKSGWSHIVCMPDVEIEQVEALVSDLEQAKGSGSRDKARTLIGGRTTNGRALARR